MAIITCENQLKSREDTLNIADVEIKAKLDAADTQIKQIEEYVNTQEIQNKNKVAQLELKEALLSIKVININTEKKHIDTIKKQLNTHECLICFECTSNNIFLPKCNNVLHMCNECKAAINKICPLCRAESKSFIKCYTA